MAKTDSFNNIVSEIGRWCEGPFAEATWQGQCRRLQEEVHELYGAYQDYAESILTDQHYKREKSKEHIAEEMADVLGILFHMAYREQINLTLAVLAKWDENKRRQWQLDQQGDSVSHIRVPRD